MFVVAMIYLLLNWFKVLLVTEEVIHVNLGEASASWHAVVTVFRPSASGKRPLLILNHGQISAKGEPRERVSFRTVGRFFAQRGYVVIAPMRPGHGGSTGQVTYAGCADTLRNIRAMGVGIKAVIEHLSHDPTIDANNIVFAGISAGAMVSLGLAADEEFRSRTRAVLVFAGVLIASNCDWQRGLYEAVDSLGRTTSAPTIWFVGESDPWLPSDFAKSLFSKYAASGGRGEFHELPISGKEGHYLLDGQYQLEIWWPYVERFMRAEGLPTGA